jgi:hypothetical protein
LRGLYLKEEKSPWLETDISPILNVFKSSSGCVRVYTLNELLPTLGKAHLPFPAEVRAHAIESNKAVEGKFGEGNR